ncbi:MAG: DUF4835 family protein [Bacteroidetes bacterium]|mgnify:CR=1 FL=1|jgi:hypothetical protein|nr:DUF4835 family protein [Bacteroidota bacterium]MBT6688024.1 DUF4835 family protein [Bacteroidota bacterium]MBT7144812.1 DUF4835 family protein [Bacteroidota bacterium]MBT7492403.1 DUF4835 family protein [Bacteroidota bacterium]
MKKIAFIFLLNFLIVSIFAQEFDCKVQVMSQQIQGTNKQIFRTLQSEIYEFMNNKKWTEHVFGISEKIDCNIMITLTEEISVDEFKGKIQIQARRPVYNSSYNSVLLNYVDNNFHIRYVEFEPLEFNETGTSSNLVNILAYYSYVILGFDYDTFGMLGGSTFFQKAEQIVSKSQNAQERGWKAFESLRNRYWLIDNLLDDNYKEVRECSYRYHRLGLDIMSEKVNDGRSEIAESLKLLQTAHRKKPGSFLMQVFFDAKADEIVNIFSQSFPDEKNRVIQILTEVDPANSTKYNKIKSGEQGSTTQGTSGVGGKY